MTDAARDQQNDDERDQLRAEVASLSQLLDIHEATVLKQSKRLDAAMRKLRRQNELLEINNLKLEKATREADEATKAKSTFLAKMSHELRTPMNAIIGYCELLREDAEDMGHPEHIPDLQKIHAASHHLLTLINDILDLSRIEAGKMTVYLEEFDLGQLVQDVASTVQPLAEKNSNNLELDLGEHLGQMYADATKVRQILFNLLSNACKFTSEGTVRVKGHRFYRDGEDWIDFVIEDTGIGMTEEQLGRLFEEFTQADESTTNRFGGTGLGLAISKRICEMMGGEIRATSQMGTGSIFTVCLPARVADPDGESPPTIPLSEPQVARASPVADGALASRLGPGTILVIDDDPAVHDLLRRILEKEGYRILTAATGQEGLALAEEFVPTAITLDVIMPSMDGWTVLAALKGNPRLAHIPVIMLSMLSDLKAAYALGAADYMTKPIDKERLLKVVGRFRSLDNGSGKILVVDDDRVARELLQRVLANAGWSVVQAENGLVAIQRISDERPCLILLDLLMPEMDGFAFLERLRADEDWRSIPVIVLTAKTLSTKERDILTGRVGHILQKSAYTREALTKMIRETLQTTVNAGTGI